MPLLCGPKNSRYSYTGTPCPHTDLALASTALTLGQALRDYELHFCVTVRPCDEPLPGDPELKYFRVTEEDGSESWLVDVHVFREGLEICPKQDLGFALQPSDLVELGSLIC